MITTLVYRDQKFAARNPPLETVAALRADPAVMLWMDLSAPTDEEIKLVMERIFAFHPLAIEDCVSDSPFPKVEAYDDYLYLVLHALNPEQSEEGLRSNELDLFLGKNFLVTFHRPPLRETETALDRFSKAGGPVVRGPDRFAHTILDSMVEAYQPVLDGLRRQVLAVEEGVLKQISAAELFPQVVALRKKISQLRQLVRPQRQIAAELAQGNNKLIRSVLLPYLRDLTEELGRIETQTTAWSDQLILSFRIYLNKSSHDANSGIRVLTGITALTFPALVIAGWYGMNFEGMHEIDWPYGYPLAVALTAATTFAMWLFMRKRKWL
jgi:magnesium transporter